MNVVAREQLDSVAGFESAVALVGFVRVWRRAVFEVAVPSTLEDAEVAVITGLMCWSIRLGLEHSTEKEVIVVLMSEVR